MKNTKLALVSTVVAGALTLAACGGDPASGNSDGDSHEISWLLSRPADGSVITVVNELADEYAKDHPGFKLNLITTPDRPSYLQKYETLAAANQLPELFDTDATPFTKKLIDQGRLVDVEELLTDLDLYDKYRPQALDYQRFDDGSPLHAAVRVRDGVLLVQQGAVREGRRGGATDPRRHRRPVRAASRGGCDPDRAGRAGRLAAGAMDGLPAVPARWPRLPQRAQAQRCEVQ